MLLVACIRRYIGHFLAEEGVWTMATVVLSGHSECQDRVDKHLRDVSSRSIGRFALVLPRIQRSTHFFGVPKQSLRLEEIRIFFK